MLETNHSLAGVPMISVATLVLLAVVLFQLWMLLNKFNKNVQRATPVYSHSHWLGVSLVLLLQDALMIILYQTDIVMVGSILGPSEAGIYSATTKTALWVSFSLQAVNMVAAPVFTTLYTQGDLKNLQKFVLSLMLWSFWPSLAIALLLIIFAQPVLGIFGAEFVAGSWELKILVLGELVSALCGSSGYLMTMTGHQNKAVVVCGCAALMNLVGNAIAIPLIGAVGAAIATALTLIVFKIWLSVLVVRHVGVNPSVFGVLFNGRP